MNDNLILIGLVLNIFLSLITQFLCLQSHRDRFSKSARGIVYSKMKFCHQIFTTMSSQIDMTLHETQMDVFQTEGLHQTPKKWSK